MFTHTNYLAYPSAPLNFVSNIVVPQQQQQQQTVPLHPSSTHLSHHSTMHPLAMTPPPSASQHPPSANYWVVSPSSSASWGAPSTSSAALTPTGSYCFSGDFTRPVVSPTPSAVVINPGIFYPVTHNECTSSAPMAPVALHSSSNGYPSPQLDTSAFHRQTLQDPQRSGGQWGGMLQILPPSQPSVAPLPAFTYPQQDQQHMHTVQQAPPPYSESPGHPQAQPAPPPPYFSAQTACRSVAYINPAAAVARSSKTPRDREIHPRWAPSSAGGKRPQSYDHAARNAAVQQNFMESSITWLRLSMRCGALPSHATAREAGSLVRGGAEHLLETSLSSVSTTVDVAAQSSGDCQDNNKDDDVAQTHHPEQEKAEGTPLDVDLHLGLPALVDAAATCLSCPMAICADDSDMQSFSYTERGAQDVMEDCDTVGESVLPRDIGLNPNVVSRVALCLEPPCEVEQLHASEVPPGLGNAAAQSYFVVPSRLAVVSPAGCPTTYQCPYCGTRNLLSELVLRSHLRAQHDTDVSLLVQPSVAQKLALRIRHFLSKRPGRVASLAVIVQDGLSMCLAESIRDELHLEAMLSTQEDFDVFAGDGGRLHARLIAS